MSDANKRLPVWLQDVTEEVRQRLAQMQAGPMHRQQQQRPQLAWHGHVHSSSVALAPECQHRPMDLRVQQPAAAPLVPSVVTGPEQPRPAPADWAGWEARLMLGSTLAAEARAAGAGWQGSACCGGDWGTQLGAERRARLQLCRTCCVVVVWWHCSEFSRSITIPLDFQCRRLSAAHTTACRGLALLPQIHSGWPCCPLALLPTLLQSRWRLGTVAVQGSPATSCWPSWSAGCTSLTTRRCCYLQRQLPSWRRCLCVRCPASVSWWWVPGCLWAR